MVLLSENRTKLRGGFGHKAHDYSPFCNSSLCKSVCSLHNTKKMVRLTPLHLLFASLCLVFFHASASSLPSVDPLPLLSLRIKPNQTASTCTYRVEINTSCSSVSYTRDKISISFGDLYGNQVYVERVDDPSSRNFEACSTDTFDLYGPCTKDVCYVYLYRKGSDGWKVGSVRISGQSTRTVAFTYNEWIPNGVWYGFNHCNASSSQGLKRHSLSALVTVMATLLLFMLEGRFL